MNATGDRDPDPILARRAWVARLTELGQRVGYALFGVAVVVFFVAVATGFTGLLVAVVTTSLIVGSVVLAPAIVFGYAVKAAEREDAERDGRRTRRR